LYTTPQEIRDLLGLTVEDADDSILEEFIDKAQKILLKYITVQVIDEEMTGSINGTNTTFSVSHKFIADIDFDKQITTSDFKIYGWKDSDDPGTKVELSVSTFYPEYGIFVLSSPPSSDTYEKITCDYSYYTCKIDWDLVNMATAYYAGMLWVARELYLVPETLAIGNVRVRTNQPWEKLRTEFKRIIYHLTALPMDIVSYRKIVRAGRFPYVYRGPGTTYEIEEKYSSKKTKKVNNENV